MEKIMKLVAASEKKQREFQLKNGGTKVIEFYELLLTDGIDTIYGETSESLTNQINSTVQNARIPLVKDGIYSVRFNINSNTYSKDNTTRYFVAVNIHQLTPMIGCVESF